MIWLASHMWLLLAVAMLLGFVIGCWICSGPVKVDAASDSDVELAKLRSSYEQCIADKAKLRARVLELETEMGQEPAPPAPTTVPTFYDAPTQGDPDDLKKIKGIGPKLEILLHSLGVYYYRQIAGWNNSQIAEVDNKLRFKGRITRDNWCSQAKILTAGGATEFATRYDQNQT